MNSTLNLVTLLAHWWRRRWRKQLLIASPLQQREGSPNEQTRKPCRNVDAVLSSTNASNYRGQTALHLAIQLSQVNPNYVVKVTAIYATLGAFANCGRSLCNCACVCDSERVLVCVFAWQLHAAAIIVNYICNLKDIYYSSMDIELTRNTPQAVRSICWIKIKKQVHWSDFGGCFHLISEYCGIGAMFNDSYCWQIDLQSEWVNWE